LIDQEDLSTSLSRPGGEACCTFPLTNKMSDDHVTLNCLILGEPPENVFPVNIARSNTVDALKGVIKDSKQQSAFPDVDAHDLILYNTFLRLNGEFEQGLDSFKNRLGFEKPLQSASKLANIFADLSEDDLHVIVRSPLEGELSVSV